GSVRSGWLVGSTMRVKRSGQAPADNVRLTVLLPTIGRLKTRALSPYTTLCRSTGGTQLSCTFGTLASGDMRTVVATTNETADLVAWNRPLQKWTETATGHHAVCVQSEQTCLPPQLLVTKPPDGGTFNVGLPASF